MENHGSFSFTAIIGLIALFSSCSQTVNVEERNKALIMKAHDEMFTKGNLNYADENFTTDYIVQGYPGKGPAMLKAVIKERREVFPDLEIKLGPIVAEGNTVAWLRTQSGTHKNNYWGHQPSGKKITWQEMVFTRYTDDGKIAEEWFVGNAPQMMAAEIDGVFEYLPPTKGQAVNRNGRFVYLAGPVDEKSMMHSTAGTQTISGDTVKNTVTYSTDPKRIGTVYWWKVKSWSADTVTFETMNEKGEITGGGRALRVSR